MQKFTSEGLNRRFEQAGERDSKIEDRTIEIIDLKSKEKRLKKNEKSQQTRAT